MDGRNDAEAMVRRLELQVAEVPVALGSRYDVSRAAPIWDEDPHVTLSRLRKRTRASLVCVRDASMEHYWEPVGDERPAAQAVFWGALLSLYDGRKWRLCLTYNQRLDNATSCEFGLLPAFTVPTTDESGRAVVDPLQYWWCPKEMLRQAVPEFWGSVGYVLTPSGVGRVRQVLLDGDTLRVLDRLLDECLLVYLDWSDGEELLILSRVVGISEVLEACRSRPVQRAFRKLKAAAELRESWQSLPPDVEPEYLADLHRLSRSGMRELVVLI